MKNTKKAISLLLILSLFIGIIPLSAQAAEGDNLTPPDTIALKDLFDIDMEAAGDTIVEKEEKREKPEKRITITQNMDLEDYLYGHSTYYNELKKVGRLDLIKNRIEDTEAVSEAIISEEQPAVEEKTGDEEKTDEEVTEEEATDDQTIDREIIEEEVADEESKNDQPTGKEVIDEESSIIGDQEVKEKQIVDEQLLRETLGEDFIKATTTSSSTKEYYNTLVGPSAMNNLDNTQYSAFKDIQETISPETGDLTLKLTDVSLPGRNGLDLNIARIYQSNQSHFGDKKISGDLTYCYEDYSTYSVNRYNLGMGWMFAFPSVQIEQEGTTKELYYHMGDGTVYRVNFTANTSDSNLEKYYKKDAVFDNDTSYSNGQVTSAYVFKTADQTKRYFGSDGRLLGIVDRFGNEIKFEHIERPVSNRSPNNDFENPETQQVWSTNSYYSYATNFGKDDSSSYKFYRSSSTTQSGLSKYIQALPNTKYYLGGYINDQLTAGTASLTYREYDQNYNLVRQGSLSNATIKNDWQHVEQYFTTHNNTRYIRLEFKNSSARGSSWVDKVVFDRAWPLISKITDSLGREVDFTYTDTLYEECPNENVTIAVNDPTNVDSITLTYQKSCWYFDFTWRFTGQGNWTEQRNIPVLWSFYNGVESQYYLSQVYPPLIN